MALPLAVFEDRNAPAAQAGSGKAALPISNPGTGQKNVREAVPRSASQAGLQLRRKQPEVSSTPHSLAQSVMLLRSQQPSSSQPQSTRPASTSKPATGHSEELVLPDDVLSPPSPRSMQILGKSRGLKRDRLESSQPTPPAKRPAINPNSASKPRLHKFKAAAPSMVLSPPQKAQPVGSNWWAQGTAQPVQAPGQLAPATHASLVQDHSRGGLPSQSGAQHMQPSGQQGSASWQPAYPSSPPVPDQAYPRGNNHVPSSSPAWASAHAQTHAEAWQSSPPVSTLPAKRAKQQPFRQPGPEHHSSAPRQQPRAGTYTGRSQDMQMQDLVNEVLAHDTPACWTNGSMHKQHSRAGAPSWPEAAGSQAHPANGHGPGQRGQAHLQPEQSWPAPDGGRYILAPAPASKKQQFKTRSAQAEWRRSAQGSRILPLPVWTMGASPVIPCTITSQAWRLNIIPHTAMLLLPQLGLDCHLGQTMNPHNGPLSKYVALTKGSSAGMPHLPAMLQPCRAACSSFTRRWSSLLPWPPPQWCALLISCSNTGWLRRLLSVFELAWRKSNPLVGRPSVLQVHVTCSPWSEGGFVECRLRSGQCSRRKPPS